LLERLVPPKEIQVTAFIDPLPVVLRDQVSLRRRFFETSCVASEIRPLSSDFWGFLSLSRLLMELARKCLIV